MSGRCPDLQTSTKLPGKNYELNIIFQSRDREGAEIFS